MRKLTAKQKKALTKAIEEYKGTNGQYPTQVSDFDYQNVILPIDNMNPCEVFWQNADRFILEYVQKKLYTGCGG